MPRPWQHPGFRGWSIEHLPGGCPGKVGVTPRPSAHSHCREKPWLRVMPRSLTVRTCGGRGDILGYSLDGGEGEEGLPLNPGTAREPQRVLTPLSGHTVILEEEGWRSSGWGPPIEQRTL